MPISSHTSNLLRVVVSCRNLTAQVMDPATSTIIAMASTTEPEFLAHLRAKKERMPRLRYLWDSRTASRIGEKLGCRLREIGVFGVHIDTNEEISRPLHHRKKLLPLFDSVRNADVVIDGAEQLWEIGPVK